MGRISFVALLVLAWSGSALAQGEDDGAQMMERGAREFLEGLLREMEPAWDQMQAFMDEMGPAMIELLDEIKDWSAYHPPEILDNGDIIIRRKPDVPQEPAPNAGPMPQIEL
jgi:hypothetical protein